MIIIPTHVTRIHTWLDDCLSSIHTNHQVVVLFQGEDETNRENEELQKKFPFIHIVSHSLNGFDPGAIVWARENCTDSEFFVLHDSCVVKDNKIFDVCFNGYAGNSVALSSHPTNFGMFLGKYKTEIVKRLDPPMAKDKTEAIELEESWNRKYCQLDYPIVLDSLENTNTFEEKHGRKNMVLENKWIKKYKGSWNRDML